jgi:hypothetical protein
VTLDDSGRSLHLGRSRSTPPSAEVAAVTIAARSGFLSHPPVAMTNLFNRVNAATRQVAGAQSC